MRRSRPRTLPIVPALVVLALLNGCGSGSDSAEVVPPDSADFAIAQTARSGSFLGEGEGEGEELELVLRGVGGASELGVEASGGGGAAGAVSTGALFRRSEDLFGSEPFPATLAGAEVGAQRYALELRDPRYDGVLGTIRYAATVVGGAPERPPASFGAATLTVGTSLRTASFSGGTTDAETGEPLAGALVELRLGKLGLLTALSGEDGTFEYSSLPAGEYRVVASLPGYERAASRVSIPAQGGIELELTPFLAAGSGG